MELAVAAVPTAAPVPAPVTTATVAAVTAATIRAAPVTTAVATETTTICASTATATAESATTTAATPWVIPRHGFVDAERATVHLRVVQRTDGGVCTGVTHLHKTETSEFAGFPICDHGNIFDRTILTKQTADLLFRDSERQITHVDPLRHSGHSSWGQYPYCI